ncbi:MAG: KTSC domain-containing protein [Gammaproteobacteria bacterium]|nr:KTSC domain-containing protein [Gammaproteobacteria bacterium]
MTQTLEVEFHGGRVYQYYGVPKQIVDEMMQAPSVGKFFNLYIREGYAYSRVS